MRGRARAEQQSCSARMRRRSRRIAFFGTAEKSGAHKRCTIGAAAAFCKVGKETEKLKAAAAPSVQRANALPLGGFCYPCDFPHLAKRRLNTVRLYSRRAFGCAESTIARLRRALLPRTTSPIHTNARPRGTAKLFRANAAAKPPHCFFRHSRKKRRA